MDHLMLKYNANRMTHKNHFKKKKIGGVSKVTSRVEFISFALPCVYSLLLLVGWLSQAPLLLLSQYDFVGSNFFFFFAFLGPEPRLGIELELQLLAYATATATAALDPSHVCDLHHSSRQCWIPNSLSKARDQTLVLMDTSQIFFCCATMGTPWVQILTLLGNDSVITSGSLRYLMVLIFPSEGFCIQWDNVYNVAGKLWAVSGCLLPFFPKNWYIHFNI